MAILETIHHSSTNYWQFSVSEWVNCVRKCITAASSSTPGHPPPSPRTFSANEWLTFIAVPGQINAIYALWFLVNLPIFSPLFDWISLLSISWRMHFHFFMVFWVKKSKHHWLSWFFPPRVVCSSYDFL